MFDAPDPLPESLRAFVDAEKSRPNPSPEVQQRTFSRLSATLGLMGGPGGVPTSSAPHGPIAHGPAPQGGPASPPSAPLSGHTLPRLIARASRRGWATFLVGAAVGATAYGTVAHLQQMSQSSTAPSVVMVPRQTEPSPSAPAPMPETLPTVEVAPRPVVVPSSPQRASGEQEPGKARDQGLAAERKWIEMARTALARGRVDGALAALRHHARMYPSGQLAEERDGLLVQSLVAKGDYAQARIQAARFARQHPHSLFAPAIDQALRSIP